ncbi:MAG: hypothetical protein O3A79_05300 [Candidatus Marinimicrobia bacterium]|nr:hypothetical protein [Candidatus Neomarinimicrobiota bacterium]
MSSYPPPSENLPHFNPIVFTVDETPLTLADANKLYFKKSGGIITGAVSAPSLTLNGINVENKLTEIDVNSTKLTDISYNNNTTSILHDLSVNGILKLPNLTNAGSEILNNKQKTTKITYDPNTSVTTIADTLKSSSTLIVGSQNYNASDQFYKLTGISRNLITPLLTITDSVDINGVLNLPNNGNVDVILTNIDEILVHMQYILETDTIVIDTNLNATGNFELDGTLNLGNITDVEQKIIDVSNTATNNQTKLTNVSYNTGTTQIDGNLNVGITSTSNSNVDINGNLKIFQKIGTPPSASGGSLTLVHDNFEGQSSIVFKHKRDSLSDYGYIVYKDHVGTGTGQQSLLELGVQNNGADEPLNLDCIALMPSAYVGVNTRTPQAMLDVSGDIICNGNFELGTITDVEQKILDVSNTVTTHETKLTNLSFNTLTNTTEFDGSVNLGAITDVEQKILDISNTVTTHENKITNLSFNTLTNTTQIDGSLNLGTITDVEQKIIDISNNSSSGIPSITYDPITQTTTFDGSFVIIPSDCQFLIGVIPDLESYLIMLNSRTSWLENTGQGLKIINNTIIEEDLGTRTSQLSIRPANDLQNAVQEIYSKNGTAELKIGDNNGTTITFNNILKSENGNATFYGNNSGETKYMEYNSTDDKINIFKDMDLSLNNLTFNKGVIQEVIGTSPSAVGGGSLTLIHDNSGGISSIVFKSKNQANNDFAYISYIDDYEGLPTEQRSLLEIAAKDDSLSTRIDNIALMPSGFVGVNTRTPTAMLDVNGDMNCSEIQVNSIPINSFTNFRIATSLIGNWGLGNHLQVTSSVLIPSYSHNELFQAEISPNSFTCNPGYYGTYEITAYAIFRNLNTTQRLNVCIGIAINDDTDTVSNTPDWYLRPHFQTPFSVQYVRMNEGKVCDLSCKRIYHFTNSTEQVSINTYVEKGQGNGFGDELLASTPEYQLLDASIQFKYLGNFGNIQN